MKAGEDPRTDQHKDREGGGFPDPPSNSKPHPAEGGVGTGTKTDPVRTPDAPHPGDKK